MNLLDIVLIIALVGSALAGLWIGIIRAALALIGLIAGIILAGNFYEPVSSWFGFISNNDVANIVAFILILVGVMLIAEGIGTHINKGYIYFAMAFALGVEVLNLKMSSKLKTKGTAEA